MRIDGFYLREVFVREMQKNWTETYEVADQKSVLANANAIRCRIAYKLKVYHSDGNFDSYKVCKATDRPRVRGPKPLLRLKARNVLHWNVDHGQGTLRRGSTSADTTFVRMIIFIELILNFLYSITVVNGAYMQIEAANREIYIRPSEEFR